MGGLARGGHAPVLITFMMGSSAIIIGVMIDSLNGLMHLFGVLCWMTSAFFVNFWRDPDRKIPSDDDVLVSPADGHVMFVRRERATGRRPNSMSIVRLVPQQLNEWNIALDTVEKEDHFYLQ